PGKETRKISRLAGSKGRAPTAAAVSASDPHVGPAACAPCPGRPPCGGASSCRPSTWEQGLDQCTRLAEQSRDYEDQASDTCADERAIHGVVLEFAPNDEREPI